MAEVVVIFSARLSYRGCAYVYTSVVGRTMEGIHSSTDGGFSMEEYEKELDAIIADVIPDMEA